jgi:hypothetical protein
MTTNYATASFKTTTTTQSLSTPAHTFGFFPSGHNPVKDAKHEYVCYAGQEDPASPQLASRADTEESYVTTTTPRVDILAGSEPVRPSSEQPVKPPLVYPVLETKVSKGHGQMFVDHLKRHGFKYLISLLGATAAYKTKNSFTRLVLQMTALPERRPSRFSTFDVTKALFAPSPPLTMVYAEISCNYIGCVFEAMRPSLTTSIKAAAILLSGCVVYKTLKFVFTHFNLISDSNWIEIISSKYKRVVDADVMDEPAALVIPATIMEMETKDLTIWTGMYTRDRENIPTEQRTKHRNTFITACAEFTKAQMLCTQEDTKANRLCAKRICYKLMKRISHRDAHIIRDLPHVLELVFLPGTDDIIARHMANSRMSRWRRALMATNSPLGLLSHYFFGVSGAASRD